jgi:hypothetical protein
VVRLQFCSQVYMGLSFFLSSQSPPSATLSCKIHVLATSSSPSSMLSKLSGFWQGVVFACLFSFFNKILSVHNWNYSACLLRLLFFCSHLLQSLLQLHTPCAETVFLFPCSAFQTLSCCCFLNKILSFSYWNFSVINHSPQRVATLQLLRFTLEMLTVSANTIAISEGVVLSLSWPSYPIRMSPQLTDSFCLFLIYFQSSLLYF